MKRSAPESRVIGPEQSLDRLISKDRSAASWLKLVPTGAPMLMRLGLPGFFFVPALVTRLPSLPKYAPCAFRACLMTSGACAGSPWNRCPARRGTSPVWRQPFFPGVLIVAHQSPDYGACRDRTEGSPRRSSILDRRRAHIVGRDHAPQPGLRFVFALTREDGIILPRRMWSAFTR